MLVLAARIPTARLASAWQDVDGVNTRAPAHLEAHLAPPLALAEKDGHTIAVTATASITTRAVLAQSTVAAPGALPSPLHACQEPAVGRKAPPPVTMTTGTLSTTSATSPAHTIMDVQAALHS